MVLNERSEKALVGVHPDLVRVVRKAAETTTLAFIVTEGVRALERQRALKAAGASRTMRSRHVPESNACRMACAVDLAAVVDGEVRWDWPLYTKLAAAMKEAAASEGVKIVCGADWKKFPDGPHFELTKYDYPYAE